MKNKNTSRQAIPALSPENACKPTGKFNTNLSPIKWIGLVVMTRSGGWVPLPVNLKGSTWMGAKSIIVENESNRIQAYLWSWPKH